MVSDTEELNVLILKYISYLDKFIFNLVTLSILSVRIDWYICIACHIYSYLVILNYLCSIKEVIIVSEIYRTTLTGIEKINFIWTLYSRDNIKLFLKLSLIHYFFSWHKQNVAFHTRFPLHSFLFSFYHPREKKISL